MNELKATEAAYVLGLTDEIAEEGVIGTVLGAIGKHVLLPIAKGIGFYLAGSMLLFGAIMIGTKGSSKKTKKFQDGTRQKQSEFLSNHNYPTTNKGYNEYIAKTLKEINAFGKKEIGGIKSRTYTEMLKAIQQDLEYIAEYQDDGNWAKGLDPAKVVKYDFPEPRARGYKYWCNGVEHEGVIYCWNLVSYKKELQAFIDNSESDNPVCQYALAEEASKLATVLKSKYKDAMEASIFEIFDNECGNLILRTEYVNLDEIDDK